MSRNLLKIRAMKEMEDRRKSEETYTMPLTKAPDMKDFLKDFYKNAYAADRKEFYLQQRETYPHSVGRLYNELCCGNPKIVSFEDFWQRYEYRCGDLDRIVRELSEKDAAAATKRQEEAARKRDDSGGANNFWNNMRTTMSNAADSLDNAAATIAADLGVGASNQQSNQQITAPAKASATPSSEKDDSEVVLAKEMALAIANNPDMTPEQFQELRSKIQNDVEQRGEAPSQIKMQRSSDSSSPSKPSLEDQRKALREREAARVRALEQARKEVARQKQQQFEEQQRKALEDDASKNMDVTPSKDEEKEEEKNEIIAKNKIVDENPPVLVSEKKEPPSTSSTKGIDNKQPTAATKDEKEQNPKPSSFSERMQESKAKAAARDLEIKQNEDVQSTSNDVSSKIAAAKRKVEARKKKKQLEKEAAKKKQLEKEAEKKKLEEEAEKRKLEKEAEKRKLEKEAEKKKLEKEAEKRKLEKEAEKRKLEKEAARAKETERIANERQPLLNKTVDSTEKTVDSTAKTYDSTEEMKAEIDSGATKRKTLTAIYWILAFVVVAVGYALMKADPNLVSSLKSIQLGDAFPSEIRTDVLEDGSSGKKKQRK